MLGIDKKPSEWRVRQTDPSGYSSYARKDMGAGVSLVLGIKDGKSETQSVRFNREQFKTKDEVKAWIEKHTQYHMAEATEGALTLSETELKELTDAGYTHVQFGEASNTWNEVTFEGVWPNSKTGQNITITEKTIDNMIQWFNENVRGLCYKDTGLPTVNWDYGHEADKEAAGWISQLEKRDKTLPTGKKVKSLWAKNHSWTSAAQEAIKDDVWLFASVDYDDFTNTVTGKTYKDVLFGVALTNRPAVKYMQSIRLSEGQATPPVNAGEHAKGETKPMLNKLRALLVGQGVNLAEGVADDTIEYAAVEKIRGQSEIITLSEKKLSETVKAKDEAEKKLSEAEKKLSEIEKKNKELAEAKITEKKAELEEAAKKAYTPAQLKEGKTSFQIALAEGKLELAETILAEKGVAFKETRKDEGESESESEDEADMNKDWDNQSNSHKDKKIMAYMKDKKMSEEDDKAYNKAEKAVAAEHNQKYAEHKKKAGGKK
jgi:hypothetical protein